MSEPVLEFAFELRVDCDPHLRIGRSADEELTFTPITGGTVAGPLLNGAVLAGGGDWAVERSGTSQLEARYLLRADDGAVIDILNRGYFRASAEAIALHEAGEHVDEAEIYFRTAPVFQTDAPAHRWLAEHQFVGLARDEDGQVCVRVFVVR
ncbi:DUF3237 domain-containing protein [Agromyces sp. PvR057]|uniref:DUF3237 domain-containing protein n=1 Tax=Agromyces sp. PvR057 TaxID=3156403 RepID=UPI000E27973D